jgi:hypothetical protein
MIGTLCAGCLAAPAFAECRLEFEATGFRECHCGVTLVLTNEGGKTLKEINGFVVSMTDGEQVSRSRGVSFVDLAPGQRASARFETLHAPCDEAREFVFVVGA